MAYRTSRPIGSIAMLSRGLGFVPVETPAGYFWMEGEQNDKKHTTTGIPTWSPTAVLISHSHAYICKSGRDG